VSFEPGRELPDLPEKLEWAAMSFSSWVLPHSGQTAWSSRPVMSSSTIRLHCGQWKSYKGIVFPFVTEARPVLVTPF